MPHQPQLQSEMDARGVLNLKYITGIENVHCVVSDAGKARDFYSQIFGSPQHEDGSWSEFKIAGLDIAVTGGNKNKFVITFTVEKLGELRAILESKIAGKLEIQHGDYGDYVEVCPNEGFCLHFFESKKKCGS